MNIEFHTAKVWTEAQAAEVHAAHVAKAAPQSVRENEDKADLYTSLSPKAKAETVEVKQDFQDSIKKVRARTRSLIDALRNGENPFGAQMKTHRENIENLLS